MDLFQMETFLAVTEERSFSRAATRLHRTQPAVSQAIAKLEAELGEVLLERSSRDGTLTDAGEILREYAVKPVSYTHLDPVRGVRGAAREEGLDVFFAEADENDAVLAGVRCV